MKTRIKDVAAVDEETGGRSPALVIAEIYGKNPRIETIGGSKMSSSAPVLRPAALSDSPALAVFAEKSFRETFGADNTPQDMDQYCREAFGQEIQKSELLDPDLKSVLALAANTIVGYGQVRLRSKAACITDDHGAEIQRLYVDSAWHGRKLALELLESLIATATYSGAKCIWLGVWERNTRAIRFYEKAGFIAVGKHKFVLGSDVQTDLILKLVGLP